MLVEIFYEVNGTPAEQSVIQDRVYKFLSILEEKGDITKLEINDEINHKMKDAGQR